MWSKGSMIDGKKRKVLDDITDNLTIDEIGYIISTWMVRNHAPIVDVKGFCNPDMMRSCEKPCFKLHAEVGCTFDDDEDDE